jgi:hypothetical protein
MAKLKAGFFHRVTPIAYLSTLPPSHHYSTYNLHERIECSSCRMYRKEYSFPCLCLLGSYLLLNSLTACSCANRSAAVFCGKACEAFVCLFVPDMSFCGVLYSDQRNISAASSCSYLFRRWKRRQR